MLLQSIDHQLRVLLPLREEATSCHLLSRASVQQIAFVCIANSERQHRESSARNAILRQGDSRKATKHQQTAGFQHFSIVQLQLRLGASFAILWRKVQASEHARCLHQRIWAGVDGELRHPKRALHQGFLLRAPVLA